MMRRILHIDMDAFFASVEVAANPALAGRPLIIGGNWEDQRGVVSTASYEARAYGVHSAMPLSEARRRCPQGIFMRGNLSRYREASRLVRSVLERVTPLVQMASIDEAYLDVTGSMRLHGGDDGIADFIKSEIRAKTGLPCTIAISPNKLVSKIATDQVKPDGYIKIGVGEEAAFLAPLPVRKLPGAGPRTCAVLERLGLRTLGELAACEERVLEGAFGHQTAMQLRRRARGVSTSEVEVDRVPKSISRETTFPEDVLAWDQVERTLAYLTERCVYALREEGLEARRVVLKLRYSDFETRTFARTLPEATALDHQVTAALRELLPQARAPRRRVRLAGVGLDLLRYNQHQLSLFGGVQEAQWERVLETADALRGKFGFRCLCSGKSLPLKTTGAGEVLRDNR
jgi:DNA polymerase-4